MILDAVLIVLLIFMMVYGYIKGCIRIVAKLISLCLAFILAYILSVEVGNYIANTELGQNMQISIENTVLNELNKVERQTIISSIKGEIGLEDNEVFVDKIVEYVFIGMGFITVFVIARIVLWIVQKILENIFELPVLRTFNKLGGVITAVVLYVAEVSIILAIINSISTLNIMNGTIKVIQSSVITRFLYEHNIITNLILSKIF